VALRVIGGEWRGRQLQTVRGQLTRPLLDSVREALFNVLAARVAGARAWDLFAGTGATGIEALSRGAGHVTFVEKSNQALAVLRANVQALGPAAQERSRIVRADAWEPPPAEAPAAAPDVIFLDPPYAAVEEDPSRAAVRARRLADRLAPGGVLCFHFPRGLLDERDFDADLDVRIREWGSSAIALLGAAASDLP
jgi:16S rRNA (guanine966-N2)-methyltransferase